MLSEDISDDAIKTECHHLMNSLNDAVQDLLNNPSYKRRRKKSTQMSPGNTDTDDARSPSGAPDAENSLPHDVSEGPQTDPLHGTEPSTSSNSVATTESENAMTHDYHRIPNLENAVTKLQEMIQILSTSNAT